MKPSQVSDALKKISSKIDNSKNPDKKKVIAAVKHLIAAPDERGRLDRHLRANPAAALLGGSCSHPRRPVAQRRYSPWCSMPGAV
jgi:hypothetical protein